jgi:hypothetical protein
MNKVFLMIERARTVVADLTCERPNVYYEPGYARDVGKTIITPIRAGTPAHFDIRDRTYIEYYDSRPLEDELRQRFRSELRQSCN